MKILIVGASGQLGKAIIKKRSPKSELLIPNKKEFDLTKGIECYEYIIRNKPDWVINSGAYTNVDKAEKESGLVHKINSEGPRFIAMALKKTRGKLLQISTDYVFNGKQNSPYYSNQPLSPINTYGISKAKAEELLVNILEDDNQLAILRTSWLISRNGNNFATKIMKLNEEKDEINVICDQVGSPTCAKSLAVAIWRLLEVNSIYAKEGRIFPRISHFSDNGIASWYDVALAVGEISIKMGFINKLAVVNPILSSQYPTEAMRPSYSVLESNLTKEILNLKKIHWRESLIKEFNS